MNETEVLLLEVNYYPFRITQDGSITMWFLYLKKTPVFRDDQARIELLTKLNEVPGWMIEISHKAIGDKSGVPLGALNKPDSMARFKAVVSWIVAKAEAVSE